MQVVKIVFFCFISVPNTKKVFRSCIQFTWITYFPIGFYIFLSFKGVQHILYNIIYHCHGIGRIYSTIFTRLHQWCHIVTDTIKCNLMNIIELLAWCSFISKFYYVIYVEGSQHRPVCSVNIGLSLWFLNVVQTKGPDFVQHILTCSTFTRYPWHWIFSITHFRL